MCIVKDFKKRLQWQTFELMEKMYDTKYNANTRHNKQRVVDKQYAYKFDDG